MENIFYQEGGQDSNVVFRNKIDILKMDEDSKKGPPNVPPTFVQGSQEAPVTDALKYDEHKCTLVIPGNKAFHLIGMDGGRLIELQKVSFFDLVFSLVFFGLIG